MFGFQRMHRPRYVVVPAAVALFAASLAASALGGITVSFEAVARTGDPVPGFNPPVSTIFNGRAFQTNGAGVLSKPCINASGQVAFRGTGSSSANFNFNSVIGIFGWTPGGGPPLRLVGEQYSNGVGATFPGIAYPVPGQPAGVKFTNFSPPLLNDRGDVVFRASYGGPGVSGVGFYATTISGGPIVKIVDTSTAVPGHAGIFFSTVGFDSVSSNNMLISLNNLGQVAPPARSR
jgi:hypothetical protein